MPGRLAIDFGTSNTVVAVWDEARREGVPLRLPDYGHLSEHGGEQMWSVPSLIHYTDDRRQWLGAQVYTLVHLDRFVDPGYSVTTGDVVLGTLLILAVLEASRRTVGWGLTLTAVFFLLQTWQADKFVGILYGPPSSWASMMESFFGKEEGLYGIPVARKHPRDGAGILSSMVESDGLVVVEEDRTHLTPGTLVAIGLNWPRTSAGASGFMSQVS